MDTGRQAVHLNGLQLKIAIALAVEIALAVRVMTILESIFVAIRRLRVAGHQTRECQRRGETDYAAHPGPPATRPAQGPRTAGP